jgi:uncharacterized protein YjbI with pentapeptide repeats
MANPQHLAALDQGVESWNAWRQRNPETRPDLREAHFRKRDLVKVDLSRSDLTDANLRGAFLRRADLSHALLVGSDLTGAYLMGANLCDANISEAKLTGANLRGMIAARGNFVGADLASADLSAVNVASATFARANLYRVRLRAADLTGACFRGANMWEADITDAVVANADFSFAEFGRTTLGFLDLQKTQGLVDIVHGGPSSLGIETLQQSSGEIPEQFLRGIGISDNFIRYAKSLITTPVEFYSCFISYSTADQEFADRLYADLQANGVRCWFAPHDVKGGRKLHEQIDEAIRMHDKLLLILSPHSMQSEWVSTEISKARTREIRSTNRVLFPITLAPFDAVRQWQCFDADTGKDSARELREYFIPDFSDWKNHDSYKNEFARLLRDLRAERSPKQ